ncbi:hypothetical protein Ahu01nite_018500 [Winogradskya humida]|uniref:NADP-dependent oxidoreductase domain-containing protein n=1 Tax=Winogradskya humida TaxID=113566 RepID=A0ABQ3ZJM4_9ACTN|nr:hypothetical protein Ahu01nite_018500 [Actinoplanes humidus]
MQAVAGGADGDRDGGCGEDRGAHPRTEDPGDQGGYQKTTLAHRGRIAESGEWRRDTTLRTGFGAMHLTATRAAAREDAISVARRAVELGVTLIDTAHMYGWGANE